jgi:hypothetical protein
MAEYASFWTWFEQELARQGYRSLRQVERAGRVGNDTIAGRCRNEQAPTDTIIRAIARAFGMTFEAVQRIARGETEPNSIGPGEKPAPQPPNLTLRELWEIVSELPLEDQRAVLDYALYRQARSGDRAGPHAGPRSRKQPGPAATPQTPPATDGAG